MNLWLPRLALLLAPAFVLASQACAKGDDSVTSVYENSTLTGDQGGTAGSTAEGGSAGGGAAGSAQAGAGSGGKADAGAGGKPSAGSGGAGGTTCSEGYTLCDGLCAFTNGDPNHCGACNIGCADGFACILGQCGDPGTAGSGGNAGNSGTAGSGPAGAAGSGPAGGGQAGSGVAGSGQAGSGQAGSGPAGAAGVGGTATGGAGSGGGGDAGQAGAGGSGCVPVTCATLGYSCGPATDGCGNPIDCGGCTAPDLCGGLKLHQCGPSCDPLAQNCTEATTACYPQTGGSKCSTKGDSVDGSDCTYANDCAIGNVCLTLAMVTKCHRICDPKGGSPGCTAPSTCSKVNDTYGICVSP